MTRASFFTPETHIVSCMSSMMCTGTKATLSPSPTTRTPMSPPAEMVSDERAICAAGTGLRERTTSEVMPSGILPSAFGISTSTR